jgi:hypothetical protein
MKTNARQVDPEAWIIVSIALLPGVVAVLYTMVAPEYGPVEKLSLSISLLSFLVASFCINQFWDDLFGTANQAKPLRKKLTAKTGKMVSE